LVRLIAVVALSTSAMLALTGAVPSPLPGYSLGRSEILRGEWFVVALVGWTILLVFVGRLVTEGALPTKVGRDAVEWPAENAEAIDRMAGKVAEVERDDRRVERQVLDLWQAVRELQAGGRVDTAGPEVH